MFNSKFIFLIITDRIKIILIILLSPINVGNNNINKMKERKTIFQDMIIFLLSYSMIFFQKKQTKLPDSAMYIEWAQ